ncbi:protein phosphatase 2C domain-containing protein [Streptomyces sp. NPDC048389]|uniref:protein phosphatase 2C domain-containing protein n=1 Tax=Streptomyces sp. NPDC048389 TaxID=3154622 RepID=UPI0034543C9D
MSEQGEMPDRPTTEDDWWSRLYDDSAPDTGPPAASSGDTLDDRFDSVADTVTTRPAAWWDHHPTPAPPASPPRPVRAGSPGGDAPDPEPPPRPTRAPSAQMPPSGAGGPHDDAPAPPRPAAPPDPRAADPAPGRSGPPVAREQSDPRRADPVQAPPPASNEQVHETRPGASAPDGDTPAVPPGPAPGPARGEPGPGEGAPAPSRGPGDGTLAPSPGPAGDAPPPGPAGDALPPRPSGDAPAPPLPARPPAAASPAAGRGVVPVQAPRGGVVGGGPPTYDAEPTALPAAEAHALDRLVPDTVLDGARYGTYTLRAASVRGDSARFRGEPRRDALLTARFGTGPAALVFVALAGGDRVAGTAHLAAADACRWIGGAVGRSHARLAEDIRAGRLGDLKSGLHRLTDRSLGKLRARATELGLEPETYTAGLRCLLLSADPACRTRVFFGVGAGGLFRLRDGVWQDLEPPVPDRSEVTGAPVVGFGSAVPEATPDGDRLTMDFGIPTPASPYIEAPPPPPAEPFRFRASVARPGDTLLLCSNGLAEPVRGEAALAQELAERWHGSPPPGMAQFLADTQLRVKGYADDRTAVAVWEA